MPRDLPDLLTEALPRDAGAPDLAAIETRVARRRAGRLGGAVLALVGAAALALQALPSPPDTPIVDEVEDPTPGDGITILPLPAPGDVGAGHANGRPVFVVHDEDGEVRVLDGISPHDSDPGALKVLVYCERSERIEDPWHGASFARNGAWFGGPAPYGLAEHEVLDVDENRVAIGPLGAAPSRNALRPEEPVPAGSGCVDSGGPPVTPLVHAVAEVAGLRYPEVLDGELALPDEPQVPVPGEPMELTLIDGIDVAAVHVGGRPAFLLSGGDRQHPLVLDAVDPHVTEFGPKVLAWCGSSTESSPSLGNGHLVDPWYGSTFVGTGVAFDADLGGGIPVGGWGGGPAPHGLGRFPVLEVDGSIVTVGGGLLPPPPRVGTSSMVEDECGPHVSLFPDAAPADADVVIDMLVHDAEYADDWWYPTPDRLMGEAPGLPPDELDRYLAEQGIDLGELDLTDLPSLGSTGLAVQRPLGVELLALDGTSHGLLRDVAFTHDDARDGPGGPVLLLTAAGDEVWVDPSSGMTLTVDGVTVLQGNEALVDRGDGAHESLTRYGAAEDGPTIVPGPLRVGNGHRLVSGPDCLMNAGTSCGDGSRILDTDIGGIGTTTPGCNPTDGFADVNVLATCWLEDDAWVEVDTADAEGAVRIDVPRYPGQPDDQPTIGHFRNAVFGGPGVVAQLSLECEVPAVVGFELDGTPIDLWGGDAWSDGPTSVLLGATVLPDGGGRVPLVQVAAGACGDTKGVPEGVWAITDDGPLQLNDITDPVALWTGTTDLSQISRQLEVRTAATSACATTDEVVQGDDMVVEVDDIDLDGDGATDRAVLASPGDPDAPLVACLADGRRATYDVGLVEVFGPVVLGGTEAVMVGATSVSAANVEIVRLIGDDLVAIGEGNANGTSRSFTDGVDQQGPGDETWGCRPATEFGEVEIVTVRTEPVDGQARVTLTTYAVSAAALDLIEESSELRDLTLTMERSEANGIAAELGLRLLCRP